MGVNQARAEVLAPNIDIDCVSWSFNGLPIQRDGPNDALIDVYGGIWMHLPVYRINQLSTGE
jgi:hypothetical protein